MCACGNDKRPGIRQCCGDTLYKKFGVGVANNDMTIEQVYDNKEEIDYWLKVLESPHISDEVREAVNKTLVNVIQNSASPRYVVHYK